MFAHYGLPEEWQLCAHKDCLALPETSRTGVRAQRPLSILGFLRFGLHRER